jgi:hypothetical protein
VLDFLIHGQNEFLKKFPSADRATVSPADVTESMLLADITAPFNAVVSMFELTPVEAALQNNGVRYMLDRILHKVRAVLNLFLSLSSV